MKGLRFFLYALGASVLFLPLSGVFWPPAAQADFCNAPKIESQRCQSALEILRRAMRPAPREKQSAASRNKTPVPAPSLPLAGIGEGTIIHLPVPTPRPVYFAPSPAGTGDGAKEDAGAGLQNGKIENTVDPRTTAGIFTQCLDVTAIRDPDMQAHQDVLASKDYCISQKVLREGGRDWQIYVIDHRKRKAGPLFVVLHDDEDSAFATAVYGIARYGGSVVAVEAGERRNVKGQDPNRNFGTSIKASLTCRGQSAPAPHYAKAMLAPRHNGQPIIALHSNDNGWSGNGGRGTVSISNAKGSNTAFPANRPASPRFADEDTLIFLAGRAPAQRDKKISKAIRFFTQEAGIHVIYEQVSERTNDCSLSHYAVLAGLAPYVNIEVENGDTKTQRAMLDWVMAYSF